MFIQLCMQNTNIRTCRLMQEAVEGYLVKEPNCTDYTISHKSSPLGTIWDRYQFDVDTSDRYRTDINPSGLDLLERKCE